MNVNTEKRYELFFGLYEEFLNLDSIVSLTQVGRGRYIIGSFFSFFSTILFNKSDSDFKEEYKEIAIALGEYSNKYEKLYGKGISKFRRDSTILDSRKNLLNSRVDIYYLQEAFKDFYLASKLYSFYMPETLFKQSLMEFNNAIAHIYIGRISSKISDNGLDQNFERAVAHLQRGTLDFYKDIFISYLSKEDEFIDSYLASLQEIRATEYGLIGDDNKIRKDIVDKYYKFFLEDQKLTEEDLTKRL